MAEVSTGIPGVKNHFTMNMLLLFYGSIITGPHEDLYDMEADPNELHNIIGDSRFKKLLEG